MSEQKKETSAKEQGVQTASVSARTDEKKTEHVVYIGPNILKLGLKQWTVYREMPLKILESLEADYGKAIRRLFVPAASLDKARAELERKETPVCKAFREVQGRRE